MLSITKGVSSEFSYTHKYRLLSYIALIALKYETPMFQEFKTHVHSITVLFLIWVDLYAVFFKINCFFPQGIVRYRCFLS